MLFTSHQPVCPWSANQVPRTHLEGGEVATWTGWNDWSVYNPSAGNSEHCQLCVSETGILGKACCKVGLWLTSGNLDLGRSPLFAELIRMAHCASTICKIYIYIAYLKHMLLFGESRMIACQTGEASMTGPQTLPWISLPHWQYFTCGHNSLLEELSILCGSTGRGLSLVPCRLHPLYLFPLLILLCTLSLQ